LEVLDKRYQSRDSRFDRDSFIAKSNYDRNLSRTKILSVDQAYISELVTTNDLRSLTPNATDKKRDRTNRN